MKIVYDGQADTRAYKDTIPVIMEEIAKSDDKVCWLDTDLSGCSGVKPLVAKYDNFVNCGICEGNVAGMAAGMAAAGMKPYIHSFAPFVSRRSFDQIFLSAGYADNAITVVGTDPGITAAFNGGTHMPFEDTGTYRMIPGSIICDCTDIPMLKGFLKMSKDLPGVKYIRVGRKGSWQVYDEDAQFQVGKGIVVREGKDCTIVASGIMVHEAMQAAEKLSKEGIECTVIDPFTVKPLDVELIRKYAEKTQKLVVAENHNKIGGLVSAVEDAVIGMPLKFGYVAIEDAYGEVGPLDYLREKFDLTDDHIVRVVKSL